MADIVLLTRLVSWFLWGEKLPYECRADLPLLSSTLCAAARVCLVVDCGCSSRGIAFVREDFLLPSLTKEVGPSAAILFHGGDIGRGKVFEGEAVSASFRFFAGGPSS
jgi:hypothetical protein